MATVRGECEKFRILPKSDHARAPLRRTSQPRRSPAQAQPCPGAVRRRHAVLRHTVRRLSASPLRAPRRRPRLRRLSASSSLGTAATSSSGGPRWPWLPRPGSTRWWRPCPATATGTAHAVPRARAPPRAGVFFSMYTFLDT